MAELRYDFGKLGKVQRTPQGGIRVRANLTRSGIFIYRDADGSETREFRPPEEVFHEDSLATLQDAPVTDLHPQTMVKAVNYRELSVGHVSGGAKRQDQYVAATLVIQDDPTVKKIDAGERREISCGYSCEIDPTPGVYEGQKYDCRQTNIRYNHVALGPEHWGRAGSEVALRLDSGKIQRQDEKEAKPMKVIKLDSGREVEYGGAEHIAHLEQQAADARKERDDARKERDEVQGKLDAKEKELVTSKEKFDAANKPEVVDARVNARIKIVEKARKVLGPEYKADGKTDREVMLDAIKDETIKDRSDDYVSGRFEALSAEARSDKKEDPAAKILADKSAAGGEEKTDARESMRQENAKGWQTPLALHKG